MEGGMRDRGTLLMTLLVVVGTAVGASGLIASASAAEALPKFSVLKPHEAQTLLQ